MKKFAEYIKEQHKESIDWPKIVGTDLMSFYTNMQKVQRQKSQLLHDEFHRELKERIGDLFQENGIEIDGVVTYDERPHYDFSIKFSQGQDALELTKPHAIFSEYRLYMNVKGKLDHLKTYNDLKDFFREYHEETIK